MISLMLTLVVIGVLLWLVNYIPWIDPQIKKVIHVVVLICVVIWLLRVFGLLGAIDVPIPRAN